MIKETGQSEEGGGGEDVEERLINIRDITLSFTNLARPCFSKSLKRVHDKKTPVWLGRNVARGSRSVNHVLRVPGNDEAQSPRMQVLRALWRDVRDRCPPESLLLKGLAAT
ncbi:hypothetical protein E2C01_043212 [Portunus trituberculatus]|uniref:Uncharacterized protein n=1 Tax=Portunus trituberculatus TaxID=210409 RepID=A0A5B7FWP4_PORTR|nr:hypothetical protein [Portunus trituberculatus]